MEPVRSTKPENAGRNDEGTPTRTERNAKRTHFRISSGKTFANSKKDVPRPTQPRTTCHRAAAPEKAHSMRRSRTGTGDRSSNRVSSHESSDRRREIDDNCAVTSRSPGPKSKSALPGASRCAPCSRYHRNPSEIGSPPILIPGDPMLFNWRCEMCRSFLMSEDEISKEQKEHSEWLQAVNNFSIKDYIERLLL